MKLFRSLILLSLLTFLPILQATVFSVDEIIKAAQVSTLQEYLASTELPVILKFYSPTCPPCNALKPIFEEFAHIFEGKIICIAVNVLVNIKEKQHFGIKRWPTLVFYKNGLQVSLQTGRKSLQELKQLASSLFGL